jgi:hypothetical protein
LPSFNWVKNSKDKTETHMRSGNIRVYLKRPWFSSGEGERLGVVLNPGKIGMDNSQYFTIWGKDPVYLAGDLNGQNIPTPDLKTFPFAADYDISVSTAELGGTKVGIAAYNVLYDDNRQMYYADIPINCYQAYFPFVKLALCRYQRHSLRLAESDCCISNIVQTDWIQLVPFRTVTATIDPADKSKIAISMFGTAAFASIPHFTTMYHNESSRVLIKVIFENEIIPKTDEAFVRVMDKHDINNPIMTVIQSKSFALKLLYEAAEIAKSSGIYKGQIVFNEGFDIGTTYKNGGFRIIVEEYEIHMADPMRHEMQINQTLYVPPMKEKLVFMDVFEVQ